MRTLLSRLLTALLVLVTALGLYNVYGDAAGVAALAETAACGRPNCAVTKVREERTPLAHSYTFQVRAVERGKSPHGATLDVVCKRELILFGAHTCRARNPSVSE